MKEKVGNLYTCSGLLLPIFIITYVSILLEKITNPMAIMINLVGGCFSHFCENFLDFFKSVHLES